MTLTKHEGLKNMDMKKKNAYKREKRLVGRQLHVAPYQQR